VVADASFPLKLGTMVLDGKKNIYGFELVVRNRPGILYVIGKEFKDRNINILHIMHSDTTKDVVNIYVVGDFSEAISSPEELIREFMENKDLFIKVSLAKKALDFIFSTSLFPIMINFNRVVVIGPAFIEGILHNLRKNLGHEMALSILYHLGYSIGQQGFTRYAVPLKLTPEKLDDLMALIDALFVSHGWARVKKYEVRGNEIIIDFEDNWECSFQDKEDPFGSHFFKGVLAGIFQRLYNKQVEIKEVKCITRGDDVCRFEIKILE